MKRYNIILAMLLFIFTPLFLWATGDFPRRTLLKESISIITLLAFSLMLGQLFLARTNRRMLQDYKMSRILKLHKVIGYILVGMLLLHPLLIVAPRYFEAGPEPAEAFFTILNNYDTTGVLLGIIAWILMLILGLTSLFRNKIGIKYKTWRVFHGILSMLFIGLASWHAIDLGRHTDMAMTFFILILAGSGMLLLLNTYLLKPIKAE
jgi:predicted ferric reductase